MVDYSMPKLKVMRRSALIWLMFCGYYYVVGTLCFLIMTPDQALAIGAFSNGGLKVFFLCSGAMSGLLLWFIGVSKSAIAMDVFLKKYEWANAFKSFINTVFSFSVLIAPLFALSYNLAIRQHLSPVVFSVLTALFLLLVTRSICRAIRVFKEINHA
ncbi:MAG TPA: hypothetical protein DDY37_06905 [Legionella sp.]|nr:hypothetical protein [Legionella sp.]